MASEDDDYMLSEDLSDEDTGLDAVEAGDEDLELPPPNRRAARQLAIRRALELRQEQKRLEADLDYLELDD